MFHSLTVKKIEKVTTDAVSVTFSVPAELKEEFEYTQGQYLTLRFTINQVEERRAYSMSSSPIESDLTVTVKKVHRGVVSNHIFHELKEGQSADVMAPQGKFYTALSQDARKDYYLFGAGSGITPLMSILKTILEQEPQSTVFLMYGNRSEETIIFKEQLDALQARHQGQLFVEHILSQPKTQKAGGLSGLFKKAASSWSGKIGRIDKKTIHEFLTNHEMRSKAAVYFICGPEGMMQTVAEVLEAKGVDKKQVHAEHFISHPVAGATTSSAIINGGAKLIAHLDGKIIETTMGKGKSILEAMIAAKADPPYSCTSGACSTCMAKLISGKVEMKSCFALDDDEIAAGYILTCQAHATTQELEVRFE
jgi:ring-1,2-phenylacetyl-CoA epoxidase subunit PaaE